MAPPPPPHPMERADSMQRLQLLTSQQEVLRRRVSLRVPSPTPFSSMSTANPSPNMSLSSSPASSRANSGSWSSLNALDQASTPSFPVPAQQPTSDDAHALCEINQQIKATLTELLNTESVRNDRALRAWVQGQLMDVEQQIRRNRRRSSGGTVNEREMADRIAGAFLGHNVPSWA
ncbi:hypothetical protein M011DRAFT_471033 [Sporormia fimetaria CBS 119925]|uniref:Uncharacterized protein n=1 Tax=Sporormia fimetaria CBS 119925 TaxID=1340428 RepID=A0A6A6V3Z1_9PLEO|nr:hypothetical protein M011DRAFT_471033 [Sporormia fimetaria CBS 119925]